MKTVSEMFESNEHEHCNFEKVENKLSNRSDLHGMILLDKLFPGSYDIIASAGHDEIWFSIGGEDLESLSEDNVIELLRCGILYDESGGSLYKFV